MTRKRNSKSVEINSPLETLGEYVNGKQRGQTKIITAVVLTIFSLVGLGLYFDFGIGILNTLNQPPQAQISAEETGTTMVLTVNNLGENVDQMKISGDPTDDGIEGSIDSAENYTDVNVGDTIEINLDSSDGLEDGERVTVVALDEPDNENVVLQRTYESATA